MPPVIYADLIFPLVVARGFGRALISLPELTPAGRGADLFMPAVMVACVTMA